ncbi:hypothetical protein SCHPADRAFT_909265 [Schizopora paradoxa]|uniref:Uncharacterized protein n=1 Tax=Schizopora paradoxa TaxID=27342 RepID=A0A0H2R743_9AGAM|nr:hypothetical protein SCHPADRAFT_909265 [Schizopora paradoxa]
MLDTFSSYKVQRCTGASSSSITDLAGKGRCCSKVLCCTGAYIFLYLGFGGKRTLLQQGSTLHWRLNLPPSRIWREKDVAAARFNAALALHIPPSRFGWEKDVAAARFLVYLYIEARSQHVRTAQFAPCDSATGCRTLLNKCTSHRCAPRSSSE